jgi:hypothetical protein
MFEIGEEVVCINPPIMFRNGVKLNFGITKYKTYTVIFGYYTKDGYIHIINDRNESQDYHKKYFIPKVLYRKLKIKKIYSNLNL